MFCKNCGQQLDENIKFCPGCGTAIDNNDISKPKTDEPPVPPVYTPPEPVLTDNGKKKKSNLAIAIIGMIATVILIAVIVIASSWQSIARSTMGELDYYLWRETKTIGTVLSTDAFDDILKFQSFSAKTQAELNMEEEFAVNADIDMSHSAKDKKTVVTANPTFTDYNESYDVGKYKIDYYNNLLSFNTENLGDLKDEGIDIDDLQFVIDLANEFSKVTQAEESSSKSSVDITDYKNTALVVADLIKQVEKQVLTEDKITNGKQEFEGKKYKTVTFTVDLADILKLCTEFLNNLLEDEEASQLLQAYLETIEDVYNSLELDEPFSADEIIDNIDDIIDELNEFATEPDLIEGIKFTVFYNSKGNIVNRTIEIPDEGTINITTNINGKASEIIVSNEVDNYGNDTINITKTEEKGAVSLDIKLSSSYKNKSSSNNTTFDISAKNIGVQMCNGVNVITCDISGDYSSKGSYSLGEGSGEENYTEAFSFDVNAEVSNDTYEITSSANDNNYEYYDLKISTQLNSKPDLSTFEEPKAEDSVSLEDVVNDFAKNFDM